jgi:subtilase family serine protease
MMTLRSVVNSPVVALVLSVLLLQIFFIAFTPLTLFSSDRSAVPLIRVRNAATGAPTGLSPAQIRVAYNLPSTGGSGTIAVVDAYDDPTVLNDLNVFSDKFVLPSANFEKYMMASTIPMDSGWALEISLDVQWAHAIAPNAKILLVEAKSSSFTDLFAAIDYARGRSDVVAISMSWGGSEFYYESLYDSHFTSSYGATFFASSGDNGKGVIYPAASPNVVAVGGTTLNFKSDGSLVSETAWSGSGGGVSAYEAEPSYQLSYGVSGSNGKRAVPDVSYDADPNSGVSVYDSTPYSGQAGWWQVGGTSASAPQWAAIQSLGSSASNNNFYQDAKTSYNSYFRDIISGSNGYSAGIGYDLVTGLGSPLTTAFAQTLTPDFSVSASPSSLTIKVGALGSSTITATSFNGFSGTVSLTANAPVNWIASLNPTPLTVSSGGSASSTLSITVPSGTTPGSYTVVVTGTSGSLTHSTTVTVTVLTTDFSLSASPSTLTIRAGSSGSSTIKVTPLNGFGNPVALSASYPSGWTVTLNPSSGTPSFSSTLKITVPSGARTGTYTVRVTGTSGSLTHSTSVTVRVTKR